MAYDPSKWFSYSKLYDPSLEYDTNTPASELTTTYKSPDNNQSDVNFYNEPSSAKELNSNIYSNAMFMTQKNKDEYDPCAPAINQRTKDNMFDTDHAYEKPDPRKLDHYITMLQKMIHPLSKEYKKKLPYDMICQLAHSILDGTVFEIAIGLKDIQRITEKNLLKRRNVVVNDHRQKKSEIVKRHEKEIEKSQSKPHQILVLEKQQKEEINIFKEKCDKELTTLDQKLVLELDQLMSDQQATLQRAGLPFFYITNDPEDIRLQMYVLGFIMKLAAG